MERAEEGGMMGSFFMQDGWNDRRLDGIGPCKGPKKGKRRTAAMENKWREFKVRVKKETFCDAYYNLKGELQAYMGRQCPIDITFLPPAARKLLGKPGTYKVQRVTRGGIEVGLVSNRNHWNPARYKDSETVLCRRLCNLLGYKAEKPETIRVRITRA
jgi:hypothetical protein